MANETEATLLLKIKAAGEEVLSRTGVALKELSKIAAAAFAAITAAAAFAIHSYREQEEATNSLNRSLINQGIYSKNLSDDYHKMASSLQRVTTFTDEAIVAAEAQLQQYLGQTKITKELLMATLDLAAAKKIDLNGAAEMVGKTIGTNVNTLRRQGITVDENALKSTKLAEVVLQLNARNGGQAKAQAEGLGSLVQMKNAIGDVFELLGEKLAPIVVVVTKQ